MVGQARISQQGYSGIVGKGLCKGAGPQAVRIFARYSDQVVVGELVWDRKVSTDSAIRRRSWDPTFGFRKGRSQDIHLDTSSNR